MCVRNLKENRCSPSNHLKKKHGTSSHLKLFKHASNDVVSMQEMKVKMVGLFLFYTYAQVLLIARNLPSY